MRKFLLASSAAALVFSLSGVAFADRGKNSPAPSTLAPARTVTATGLMFSKNADDARAIDQSAPVQAALAEPTAPAAPAKQPAASEPATPDNQAAPVEQSAQPLDKMKPAIAA